MRYYPDIAMLLVQTCCCLHNFLRSHIIGRTLYVPENSLDVEDIQVGTIRLGEWRQESAAAFVPLIHQSGNRHANAALRLRNDWCNYFNSIGTVPWQDRMVR